MDHPHVDEEKTFWKTQWQPYALVNNAAWAMDFDELLIMGSSLANQGGVDYKNPYECSASCHSENWQHGEAQKSYPACSLTTLQIFTTSPILVREKV